MSVIYSHPTEAPAAPSRKVTGFALPGYASRAARKGHALGLCRRWSAAEARERASAAGRASVAKRLATIGTARLLTKGEALP